MQPVLGTAISWLLSTYTILSLLSFHFASASPGASSCLAQSTFSVNFEGECTYATVAKGVGAMLDETCPNDASDELQALLGASSRVDTKQKVDTLCQSGYKAFKNDNTKEATFQTSALPEGSSSEDGGSWLKMWGIGALSSGADYGHLWSELQNQNAFYIKRDCLGCVNSHKTIIYKRLTPVPSGLNLFDLFTKNWFSSPSNVLNTDFKLYSTMEDALNDANAWTRCNYNDNGIGFPRDCGPNSLQGSQWSSTTRGGQADVAFYSFRSAVIGEKRDIQLRWPQQITGDPKSTERLRTAMLFALALSDDDFVNGLYFVSTNMMRITNQACARFTIAEYWTFTTTSATLDKSIIQKKNCDSSATQNDSLRSFFTSITTSEYLVKLVNIAGSSTIEEYGQIVQEVKKDYETTKIITPSEDAFVRSDSWSGRNYGAESRISVKPDWPGNDSSHRVSLLQFYVGSLTAGCAKLKLYVKDVGPSVSEGGPSNPATTITVSRLYASSAGWLESAVTYDNVMPLNVEKVGASHGITRDLEGSWIEFDVTNLVEGDFVDPNGWLLLSLDGTPEGDELLTKFGSREDFDKKPYLEINTEQSCTDVDIAEESVEYSLVYKLDIPETANFNSGVDYAINQVDSLNGYGFDRVAYRMDLESERYGSQSLWVSFDAHTTSLNQLGVPNAPSGAVFQEGLSNMNVISTIPGLNGKNLNGNIEFWPSNYGAANIELVPGASGLVYDWGDQNSNSGDYGSMQIHSSDLGSTLFALNRWNRNEAPDLGIGNTPESTNTDWTFQNNAGIYTKKELSIYARVTGE